MNDLASEAFKAAAFDAGLIGLAAASAAAAPPLARMRSGSCSGLRAGFGRLLRLLCGELGGVVQGCLHSPQWLKPAGFALAHFGQLNAAWLVLRGCFPLFFLLLVEEPIV